MDRAPDEPVTHRALSYGVAVASVLVALLVRGAVDPFLGDRQPYPTFAMAVAVAAWLGGLGPALLAIMLGWVAADWFFIAPRGQVNLTDMTAKDVVGGVFYLAIGGLVATLTESLRRAKGRAHREARAARASEARLQASQEELRALAARLHSTGEEERTRIERELHDDLGQALTALKLQVAWLNGRVAQLQGETSAGLLERTRSVMELADQAVETVRRTAAALRPPLLDAFGLRGALEWKAVEFERCTNVRCEVTVGRGFTCGDNDVAAALFQIVQEALTNVARHAHASRVDVDLQLKGGQVCVRISDDGRGITAGEGVGLGSLGLLGMRERARRLGGEVVIRGIPGQGTTVMARVPLVSA